MSKPLVSVIMSVYNGERYLREAIESTLKQTFRDFEFLIINDGSTDGTAEILKSYHDPRIKIINNKKNIGLTKSLNKGLRFAKGEYIARQDADDVSAPYRLEKEVNFLETHRNYAVVGTFVKILNEDSEVIACLDRLTEDIQIRERLGTDNCITHGSAVIRKKCLLDRGFYDESIVRAQDYELWLRLSEKYRLANIPEYLYMWRKHNENIEAKHIAEQKISVILAMIKHKLASSEHATILFANLIASHNLITPPKLLGTIFSFVKFITFNKIGPKTLYKLIYRMLFTSRVNIILKDFKMNNIGFEKATSRLKEIMGKGRS
jgi:glycosyltransferase involved in cell wall biosynthesis